VGGLLGGTAQAKNQDLVELGIGVRYLFDSGFYKADNKDVNYDSDTFPLVGDQALGFGAKVAIGHEFDSVKGPWDVLLKYNYSTSPEDNRNGVTRVTDSGMITEDLTGQLDQHDLLLVFRLPGTFMPLPLLNNQHLYYDLGMGVSTLSYDYTYKLAGVETETSVRTRSGLAYNVGIGYRLPLNETWTLNAGADLVFSKIQDINDASGTLSHYSPGAHGMRLQVGLVHYFESLF
jgi:hypothetical protein